MQARERCAPKSILDHTHHITAAAIMVTHQYVKWFFGMRNAFKLSSQDSIEQIWPPPTLVVYEYGSSNSAGMISYNSDSEHQIRNSTVIVWGNKTFLPTFYIPMWYGRHTYFFHLDMYHIV